MTPGSRASSLLASLPPPANLLPYTTLFRSIACRGSIDVPDRTLQPELLPCNCVVGGTAGRSSRACPRPGRLAQGHQRSEEHTSELQSRPHLVCRLLLEKKKLRESRRVLRGP